jgi:DNA-binding NarL/FixJ family response regulator
MQVSGYARYTRIGLISYEPIRLAGLETVFEGHPWIAAVTGEMNVLLSDPMLQCLVLDLSDRCSWLEIQAMVRRARPDLRQIVLGPTADDEIMLRSISAGARAYLDSSSGPFALRQAVETVMQGTIWASRRVLSMLVDRLLSQQTSYAPTPAPVYSPRERQVLDLILTARSNREIAEELGIEERTVKAYVASLLRKTGADNRVSLSVLAMQESKRSHRELAS